MTYKLLVDGPVFWDVLRQDIQSAQQNVYIQAMSFEGDATGRAVVEALKTCQAPDKRLLIDRFSEWVINDQFIFYPPSWFKPNQLSEILATRRLFKEARSAGIQVKLTNPVGLFLHKYPLRNHKKMVVIDNQIAYVGGINFCDHNFDWHDFMIRIENPDIAACLSQDFETTFGGHNQSAMHTIGNTQLFFLNGRKSNLHYHHLLDRLASANRGIQVFSPYLTNPFVEALGQTAIRGIDVQIITPQGNNKPLLKHYLQYQCQKYPFQLQLLADTMFHMKAIIIDDETLLVGSSNFDFVSYYLEQEVVLSIKDADLVADFRQTILTPKEEANQLIASSEAFHPIRARAANLAISIATLWCRLISRQISI